MQAEKLSITLPADLARMIRGEVERGAYGSDSEVIRDALRLWLRARQEREHRLTAIRTSLEAAAENPERISDESVSRHFAARLAGQQRSS